MAAPISILRSASEADLFDPAFLARVEQLQLLSRRIFRGRQRAGRRSRKTGASLEFADYREFVPGDDLRNVDWSVYGRSDRLFLKLYEEEEDLHVHILVDGSASMGGEPVEGRLSKFDVARRLAAALAYIGLCGLDRVDIYSFAGSLGSNAGMRRGRQQFHVLLDFIRRMQAGATQTALATTARVFVSRVKRRGLVTLISDLFDPQGAEEAVNVLRYARFEVQVVTLLAPEELNPPAGGDLQLIDSETGERIAVNASREVLADYRAAMKKRMDDFASFCSRRGVAHALVTTADPFDDCVLRLLRQSRFVE